MRSFLQNHNCYDQFSVIYGDGEKTAIFLNSGEPSKVEERAVSQYMRHSSSYDLTRNLFVRATLL